MKHAPLRGLRCLPRESTGSMSGKCGWAFDMANLPGRSDLTRPVCADTALSASMRRTTLCCLTNQAYSTGIMAPPLPAQHTAAGLGRLGNPSRFTSLAGATAFTSLVPIFLTSRYWIRDVIQGACVTVVNMSGPRDVSASWSVRWSMLTAEDTWR
jgi:hypothetical protein